MKPLTMIPLFVVLALGWPARAEPNNPNTDWFREAKYGVFMHFLPGDPNTFAQVEQFDARALAAQLEQAGAKYLVLTLGQNSGYYNSPNAVYERYTGYVPGERCSKRDLPLDLYRVLQPRGIRLMLYLPCQVPNQDAGAQKAFGLREGKQDQPLDLTFANKWAEVIYEWSSRYGDKVAGWWFDGGYQHIHFNEAIAAIYARAVKRGHPKAIVTFNPGVRLIHYTQAEDYTAGELNEPFKELPSSRWFEGSQWHALTFLGSQWGQRNTRYTDQQWADWVRAVTAKGGVVTLDLGPNYDPKAGPIGALDSAQLKQVKAVKAGVRGAE
jgi:alpha-L-fucosidase